MEKRWILFWGSTWYIIVYLLFSPNNSYLIILGWARHLRWRIRWHPKSVSGKRHLTLFDRMVFHVVGDRDVPIGTGYFVLLLPKVCQLGCALHVSGDQGVPIGPQAGQGRQGSLPCLMCANWHKLDISNIQAGGHLPHLSHQQPY